MRVCLHALGVAVRGPLACLADNDLLVNGECAVPVFAAVQARHLVAARFGHATVCHWLDRDTLLFGQREYMCVKTVCIYTPPESRFGKYGIGY